MMTVYKAQPTDSPRETTLPVTVIVIDWPVAQDRRPDGLDTRVLGQITYHDEDEPTWEDAAWV